ncbi:MAG: lipid II flippase MurJ [Gemmatimonadales bacterium]|nr:lipid II flippase MurJ [Gemmatimonadales bacterium]
MSGARPAGLASRSAALAAVSVAGTLSGFAREAVVAAALGTSATYDAFLVASLPFELLSVLAASVGAPLLRDYLRRCAEDGPEAADAWWRAVTLAWAAAFLVAGIAAVGSVPLWSEAPADRALLGRLLVAMAPAPALGAVVYLQAARLNARGAFVLPALGGILLNVGVATGAALGAVGASALGLAAGTLAALAGTVLLQARAYRGGGSGAASPGVALAFARLAWPLAALALVVRVHLLLERGFGARLGEGTVAELAYANRFATAPIGIMASVATPLFAMLSAHAVQRDEAALGTLASRASRLTVLLTAPLLAFLVAFAEPLVRLALARGRFPDSAVAPTAMALRAFACASAGWIVADLAQRVLWAQERLRPALAAGVGFLVVNLLAALLLVPAGGGGGLAWARAVAFAAYAGLSLAAARSASPSFGVGGVLRAVGVAAAVSGAMAMLARSAHDALVPAAARGVAGWAALGVAGAVMTAAYGGVLAGVLRHPDAREAFGLLRRRVSRHAG